MHTKLRAVIARSVNDEAISWNTCGRRSPRPFRARDDRKCLTLVILFFTIFTTSCAKLALEARVNSNVEYLVRSFVATPNEVYYAVRDALLREGYGVAREDLASGLITSTWVSTTADSHYVDLFNRRNYIINGGYYQLDIRVMPEGPATRLEVAAVVKSAVANLRSAGKVEKRLLADVANGLRKQEPVITNLGIAE